LKQLEELDWHNKVNAITQFALNLALYYGLPGYVRASCGLTPPVCLMSDWILTCTCSAYNSIQPRLATGRHRNPYKNASCG
jgi:hypothetical protein